MKKHIRHEAMQSISDEEIAQMNLEREKDVFKGLDRLRSLVRRFPLHELLWLFASFNWPRNNAWEYLKRSTKDKREEGLMYWIYLPALAKFAILNSNDHVGESNRSIAKAFTEIREMLVIVNDIKDWIPYHLFQNPRFAIGAFNFQLMNQHAPFQEKPFNIIGRSLALFRDIPGDEDFGIDLSSAFQEIYGISLHRFWVLTIKLLATYNGSWNSNIKFRGLNEPPLNVKYEEAIQYFKKLSLSYEQFRQRAHDAGLSFKGKSTQFYGYTPFDSHPIVSKHDEFLIISPHYFMRRMHLPIYFDLLDHFQRDDDPKNNRFSSSFGKIFQAYVGRQLKYIKDSSELLPELKYDRDNKKFVDWILKYDNEAILIEVKKNVLPQKARYLIEEDQLKESLRNTLVKGLKQCYQKIRDAERKPIGLKLIETVERFYPIIITFDETYLLNSDFIREIVEQELEREAIRFQHDWQVLTIRELEQVVTTCQSDQSFLQLLKNKLSNPEYLIKDWDNYLNAIGLDIQKNEMITEILKREFEKVNQESFEAI